MNNNKTFKQANYFWFHQGRTAKAIAAYQKALQQEPTNPVFAFQYARVLWSVDRFDEARFLLDQAQVFSHQLNTLARMALDHWVERLSQPTERCFQHLSPTQLDRDVLESGAVEVENWQEISDAANAREMYGLALYALDRWGRQPIDAEDARDMGQIETNRDGDEAMLSQMWEERNQNHTTRQSHYTLQNPSFPKVKKTQVPLSRINQSTKYSQTDLQSASNNSESLLPELPLSLIVSIIPAESGIDEALTMVATLKNPTAATIVINSRLLINHQHAPGEIWLAIEGPKNYSNSAGFRVNPGQTPEQFYIALSPGQQVEQTWILTEYQSLDSPGEYTVSLTYHNETEKTPDGRTMAVGKVVGKVSFIRKVVSTRI